MHVNDPARCALCGGVLTEICRFPDTARSPMRCGSCGHRQLLPQPDEAALEALYGREEYFSGDLAPLHDDLRAGYGTDTPIARLYRRHLDRIAEAFAPPARLLEVGSARGVFADLARARGYRVMVTDRNSHAVAYAARHFGVPGVVGRFSDVDVGGPYDVITSFDVIEHVPDPVAFLTKIAALLAPGGITAVGTPDAASPLLRAAEFAARFSGGRWRFPLWRVYGDGREHLHLFSRSGLARLAVRAGLVPESAYGYSIPARNMRSMPSAYAALVRASAFVPYETVLIARKK
jgi:SAM-dependent methyltransferase